MREEIRRVFTSVQMVEQMAKRRLSNRLSGLPATRPPEQLGDYRIVREIGRGGMGVVYEAEQMSLRRRVAVKVLPRQFLLDSRSAQRFAREAQTAAKLHHTNIVPVFGVGTDAGYHYYVMQRIEGVGLDAVLACLPKTGWEATETRLGSGADSPAAGRAVDRLEALVQAVIKDREGTERSTDPSLPRLAFRFRTEYWRSVARIGVQAADALEYAHSQGTLHRDIKPANLLLDAQGVLCVADFGLAKAVEGETLSQTGDVVGTLRYMAPEQFSGQADARSDVYSLGLTLYELLALQPAFADTDRSQLMRKISQDEPVPLRSVNPKIPRDLETIVAKATAREPDRRYQAAAELARDLHCFLEDRPIHARRITRVEQFSRWCRRNPAIAGLGATALTLLVLVAVVTSIGYVRTKNANIRVNAALTRAETVSGLSLQALDDIFEQFAPDRAVSLPELTVAGAEGEDLRVPVQPVLSKEAAALLEHMLGFYDRLSQVGAGDVELRQKAANANRRVGDIRQRLGQFEQAEGAYRHALKLYQELQPERPRDMAIMREVGRIHNEMGVVQLAQGRPTEARASYGKALDVLASVPLDAPTPEPYQFELARTYYLLSRRPGRESGPGPPEPKDEPDRRGDDRQDRPPPKPPPKEARPNRDSGPPDPDTDRQEREGHLSLAIAILEALVEQHPVIPDYRLMLAHCYRELPPGPPGRTEESSPDPIDRATEVLRQLAEDYPDVPDYRYELCETLATTRFQGPRFDAEEDPTAEQRLHTALEISQELVRKHPNIPEYAAAQVHIRHKLAHVLRETSRPKEAEASLRTALDLQSALVRQFPAVSSHRVWQAVVQESLADLLRERGELNEARSLLEEAIATLNECLAREWKPEYERLLSRNYENLADVLTQLGEPALAEETRRRAR